MADSRIRPDTTRRPTGGYPGLGPTVVAQIRRLALEAEPQVYGNAGALDRATQECSMCGSEWPRRDFFPAAGDGQIKSTCPHCRYRSAFKAACRVEEAKPDGRLLSWGDWQPSGPARALATPCYDPFTGAVWSAADARHRTPVFAASREADLKRIKPFTPLLNPDFRPVLDGDGCWIMPRPEPVAPPPPPAPRPTSTPTLFDQAKTGEAVVSFTRADVALSAQDGDLLITLRVDASALRDVIAGLALASPTHLKLQPTTKEP